jgi:hypothetical protein
MQYKILNKMNLDTKILEILNQLMILVIYGITISRLTNPIDLISNILTISSIIISIALMFFIWYLKDKNIEI